jgi:hypothetical protein
MFSFAFKDWRKDKKSSLLAKKVRLTWPTSNWQIEAREQGLHIEKRIDSGNLVSESSRTISAQALWPPSTRYWPKAGRCRMSFVLTMLST